MARRRGRARNVFWGSFILEWFKHLQDHELSAADYRILFYLCERMMTGDNTAHVRQKTIAKDLAMDKGNVSKCIKKLCTKQFIAKADNGYMINPNLFYVGIRDRNDREDLRDNFDDLLTESPRFYMNEDEHELEVFPQTYDDDVDKPPF